MEKAHGRPEDSVHVVRGGPLAGYKLFLDPSGEWQNDMLTGIYDSFLWKKMDVLDLDGKIIFDIGSQIGHHAMAFAKLVGPNGCVHAFEPNTFNFERLQKNIAANPGLSGRIVAHPIAISDKEGREEFIFSSRIEKGSSASSFLDRADAIADKNSLEQNHGFKRALVETSSLDTFIAENSLKPYAIKIDVEGAEYLVMNGVAQTLKDIRPIFFIEMHTILNMFKVGEILHAAKYRLELLDEGRDGRSFIAAFPL